MPEQNRPIAVHFGAGNIGRGFIGALLQDAGYFVVFADVNQQLIDAMRAKGSYNLVELDQTPVTRTYDQFMVLHSVTDFEALTQYIADAELVTASVGANLLTRIAPTIEAGLKLRNSSEKLVVMACENALRASETIRDAIADQTVREKAIFCNTAVDRIVPLQLAASEPDVAVEPFSEWIVDQGPLGSRRLDIAGAIFVPDLNPFIERKLYTVNTAHLAIAYLGQLAGYHTVVEAMMDPEVLDATRAALEETTAVLIAKHGISEAQHRQYLEKTLQRISNPAIDDELVRVGRDPIRKLSRFERLVGPAAYYAEHLGHPAALLRVISAALSFESESDESVARLQLLLTSLSPSEFALEVCGIGSDQALFQPLSDLISKHQSALAHPQLG